MIYDSNMIFDILIKKISGVSEVQSVGISGSKSPLPKVGEGDIDIFVYCDRIPSPDKRQELINQMGNMLEGVSVDVFKGGHWGVGDFASINGVETWMMYFTTDETTMDVESILRGEYPDKLDNYYYPVGRCAMFKNMSILYDRNDFLSSLKERLSEYPQELEEKLVRYHMEELDDVEDLERAVLRRDVLFYHFALDIAIDHFLQALFAMNKVYFPSRKRTIGFIESFKTKPQNCSARLLEVVKLGSCEEDIEESYKLWSGMIQELKIICG